MSLWEAEGKSEGVVESVRPGFYQDLETLAKLVGLLPAGLSRVGVLAVLQLHTTPRIVYKY